MIKNVTLGADPEFFLYDTKKKMYVSAEGLIGGQKNNHTEIPTGEMILEDNVMVEFCTTICKNAKQLNKSVNNALVHLRQMLPKHLEFRMEASAELDWSLLTSEQATQFGCMPDSNAYTLRQNTSPDSNTNLRTCSGHVHIGFKNPNFDDCINLVKMFDLFLAVPSVLVDKDRKRREMYGKAGAHRMKPFGVECRQLSNFWVGNEELTNWLVSNIFKMIELYNNKPDFMDKVNWDLVQICINEYDTFLAEEFISKYNIDMPESYVNTEWELIKEKNKTVEAS
jgi:hypothetical protein